MAVPAPVATDAPVTPRWGLGDAAVGWLIGFSAASIVTLIVFSAFGYTQADIDHHRVPLVVDAISFPPLWLGFVGVPIWAAATKGNGWIRDFRVRFRWIDAPIGIVAGLVAQFVIVPLVAVPVLWASGKSADDLAKPAHDLADRAHGSLGIAIFALIVVVGAPFAEELFFRGLVLRSFEKRYGVAIAVAATSLVFGITHFEALLTLPLAAAGAVFALLAVKADRLGPAVFAHMTFNGATVVSLLAAR